MEAVHPRKSAIFWPKLEQYAQKFDQFGNIYTTNYDALLYHIIMIRRDRWENGRVGHPYNDYYWDKVDESYLRFKDFQNLQQYKHVYYLHGALFLFQGGADSLKVRAGSVELIEEIATRIREGRVSLFVSEGRSDLKREAIARSEYLRFSNHHLREPRARLVIFGFSFGDQDQHILDAMRQSTVLDIGVYVGSRTSSKLEAELSRIKARLGTHRARFFQAEGLFS